MTFLLEYVLLGLSFPLVFAVSILKYCSCLYFRFRATYGLTVTLQQGLARLRAKERIVLTVTSTSIYILMYCTRKKSVVPNVRQFALNVKTPKLFYN